MAEWEYRAVHLPVGVTARHAREVLGIHAEFGGWELARVVRYVDGSRRVTLRRKRRSGPLPLPGLSV